jgi:hypothetical protein
LEISLQNYFARGPQSSYRPSLGEKFRRLQKDRACGGSPGGLQEGEGDEKGRKMAAVTETFRNTRLGRVPWFDKH